jgi:hypothetical protein
MQAISIGLAGSSTLRYGWTADRPPQHQVNVEKRDLTETYKPTDRLMAKLTDMLMRQGSLDKPGFTNLSNFDTAIPVHHQEGFLKATIIGLKQRLETQFKQTFNPDNMPLTIIRRHMIDGKVLKEGNISAEDDKGNWTLKSPHFDRGAFVVMHKYNPTENVTGGNFQVIDVSQFLADNPKLKLGDMLMPDKQVHPDYWEKLKPYVL